MGRRTINGIFSVSRGVQRLLPGTLGIGPRIQRAMILSQLSLLALLQVSALPSGVPGDSIQGPLSLTEHAEVLGLVPVRPTGNAKGPVLTIVGAMGVGGFLVELQNSPTSFAEEFFVQLPPAPSKTTRSPLLVAFHKFGSTALDIPVNTDFEQECFNRNWFLVAPLGASTKSFSSISSQLNTEVVIELMVERFGAYIDSNRIYGVGFSMGGSNAMNYAARHLDPSRPMFAAIINHTGPVSLRESYLEQPNNQFILDLWYGGDPDQFPFRYARSSVLDIYSVDNGGGIGPGPIGPGPIGPGPIGPGPIGPGPIGGGGTSSKDYRIEFKNSLITNLSHVPLYIVRAKNDPLTYISAQLDLLTDHLSTTDQDYVYKKVGGVAQHLWSTLNEKNTLNWMAGKTLQLPTSAFTIADRDDTYFYFDLKQEGSGRFTRFNWRILPAENALHILNTDNLREITFNVGETGLDTTRPLKLHVSMRDNLGDLIRITGYDAAPGSVTRNGKHTRDWRYDATTKVVYLREKVGGQVNHWTISKN